MPALVLVPRASSFSPEEPSCKVSLLCCGLHVAAQRNTEMAGSVLLGNPQRFVSGGASILWDKNAQSREGDNEEGRNSGTRVHLS